MTIKAISLWEPWATAWAILLKKGETRAWAPKAAGTDYRGPLAIHAAKKDTPNLRAWFVNRLTICAQSRYRFNQVGIERFSDLRQTMGHVIAICRLDQVKPAEDCTPDTLEQSWGDYSPGRYIWFPTHMTRLPRPVPCVGRQALFNWDVPADIAALPELQPVFGSQL